METIEFELDKDSLYELMLLAHKQDITLNILISNILREKLDELQEKE
jgi:hypothetical protein